jgi:hypothetical protein
MHTAAAEAEPDWLGWKFFLEMPSAEGAARFVDELAPPPRAEVFPQAMNLITPRL